MRQEMDAAVAASHRDDPANRRIPPRVQECASAKIAISRDILRSSEDTFLEYGIESELSQFLNALVELFADKAARRRNNRNPISRLQARWLQHPRQTNAAISSAIA